MSNLIEKFTVNNSIQNDIVSPLDQFEIRDILNVELLGGNIHLSLTNIGLYLLIGALIILIPSIIATNYNKLVSNN
jgi:F-type H+-transporting ATPase subunit a